LISIRLKFGVQIVLDYRCTILFPKQIGDICPSKTSFLPRATAKFDLVGSSFLHMHKAEIHVRHRCDIGMACILRREGWVTTSDRVVETKKRKGRMHHHDAAAAFCSARAFREPLRAKRALRRNLESTPRSDTVRCLGLLFMPFLWALRVWLWAV